MSKPTWSGVTVFQHPSYGMNGQKYYRSSQEVWEQMKEYGKADRECMIVIFLDGKNAAIHTEVVSVGTVDSAAVYPREVMKLALMKVASSIILIHNHPTGDPEPSLSDRQITEQIVCGARVLGLKVLDHIIIGRTGFFSFGDRGLIEEYGTKWASMGGFNW